MSVYTDAQSAYARQSILTAPPERLVIMLYDGAIRALGEAAEAVERSDVQAIHTKVTKAGAIVDELNASLDMSYGELPDRLRSIYEFAKRELLSAMINRDAAGLRAIAGLLGELREAWAQVAESGDAAAAASR